MSVASKTFVVLIGVDRYPHLPRSGQLRGAVHDATAWHRFAAQDLGVPPSQSRILLSRHGTEGLLEGLEHDAATVANAERAIQAMSDWLREHPDGTGLLVFSGHGATGATATTVEGMQLRLCLRDFDPQGDDPYAGTLGLGLLERHLGEAGTGIAERVTLITDCCYSAFQLPARDITPHALPSRLILGSGEFSPAFGTIIDGHWQGAFTHAMLTALSLWRTTTHEGVRYVMGSYQDLVFHARALLAAMGFAEQQPVCAGAQFMASLPFNWPGTRAPRTALSLTPNTPRLRREVSGELDHPTIWSLNTSTAPVLVLVEAPVALQNPVTITVGDDPDPVAAGETAIYLDASALQATTLTLHSLPYAGTAPNFTCTLPNGFTTSQSGPSAGQGATWQAAASPSQTLTGTCFWGYGVFIDATHGQEYPVVLYLVIDAPQAAPQDEAATFTWIIQWDNAWDSPGDTLTGQLRLDILGGGATFTPIAIPDGPAANCTLFMAQDTLPGTST